jgi:hypothetical protein
VKLAAELNARIHISVSFVLKGQDEVAEFSIGGEKRMSAFFLACVLRAYPAKG